MQLTATSQILFVRRTVLNANESRYNFRQLDNDAIRMVRSRQARKVTNLMAHIYLCLIDAPLKFRQSEGELYFTGEVREEKHITAWEQLIELLEVADGTALKALRWMHEQGAIGYYAGKNGVGIRIFINRAAASIKQAPLQEQKNLPSAATANNEARVSRNAMPFKENPREIVDNKINTFAPESGANSHTSLGSFDGKNSEPQVATARNVEPPAINLQPPSNVQPPSNDAVYQSVPPAVVAQLREALVPTICTIAAHTAARESAREGEKTRAWLDHYGLPKAARVAQREAYNVFKHQSAKIQADERTRAELQVGRSTITSPPPEVKPLTTSEISELAETCVTMLEVQGKAIDETLSEISAAPGGWVTAEDVPKVRTAALALMLTRNNKKFDKELTAYVSTPLRKVPETQ